MIEVAVAGAAGRMGKRIIANLCADPETKLAGALEAPGSSNLGSDACELAGCEALGIKVTDSAEEALQSAEVLIAFTLPEATISLLEKVATAGKAIVIGTTGHTEEQQAQIKEFSQKIPIVMAPNMSVGVNVLWKLVQEGARVLGSDFRVDITETHHVHKKDKPSGTALEIVKILSETLGVSPATIPCESIREGEVVGDHTTLFQSPDETLTVTHHAETRDIFAKGAIRAAKWLNGKPASLYDMQDVLGLKT